MFRIPRTPASARLKAAIGGLAVAALALTGCASSDPLADDDDGTTASGTITVGSQAYYSNEIIAEIYAQALESAGFEVERRFNIGQRDAYIPSIENGEVDLFPEYTGNLLQFYDPETTATEADEVYAELRDALPDGLTVLDRADASDQDSYTVTAAFAEEHRLESIADLANVSGPLTLGGNPELEERPYGPRGLEETYGVSVDFVGTGDTTVDELLAGTVNIANVFTADPRIQTESLVTLADPEGLFLASNVVPLVNADIADEIAEVINAVSAKLTAEALVDLNVQSAVEERSFPDIASEWLRDNDLL